MKKMMRTRKILIISQRLEETDWKYFRISVWAPSTFSCVSSTFASILREKHNSDQWATCIKEKTILFLSSGLSGCIINVWLKTGFAFTNFIIVYRSELLYSKPARFLKWVRCLNSYKRVWTSDLCWQDQKPIGEWKKLLVWTGHHSYVSSTISPFYFQFFVGKTFHHFLGFFFFTLYYFYPDHTFVWSLLAPWPCVPAAGILIPVPLWCFQCSAWCPHGSGCRSPVKTQQARFQKGALKRGRMCAVLIFSQVLQVYNFCKLNDGFNSVLKGQKIKTCTNIVVYV